ncbi:MAG TPA: chaperone modulator CbpM [Stellaceae bacterium]|nr:chaperone modulator CbpM [Stellaceae bacterium]
MIDFDAVLRQVRGVRADELEEWIEARWVLPERMASGYVFHEIDVARVHLIVELRHELSIEPESMPVILNLLDQVYALRNRLKSLREAIETLPAETQAQLLARLKE